MYHRLFVPCLSLCLLLSACKPQAPSLLPVTGDQSLSAPAQVELVRDNVLEYAISSERLEAIPRDGEWELETSQRLDKEYRYHNRDWLIIIWLADTDDGNKRIIIFNKVEQTAWTGYVTVNGDVVDTHYVR